MNKDKQWIENSSPLYQTYQFSFKNVKPKWTTIQEASCSLMAPMIDKSHSDSKRRELSPQNVHREGTGELLICFKRILRPECLNVLKVILLKWNMFTMHLRRASLKVMLLIFTSMVHQISLKWCSSNWCGGHGVSRPPSLQTELLVAGHMLPN